MEQKKKTTGALLDEMKRSDDYESYRRENDRELQEGKMKVARVLNAILAEKGLVKKDVIVRSCLMDKYAYQILSGKKDNPSRDKVLALCIAMEMSLDEIQRLLNITGYAQLYARDKRDNIIIYGIEKGLGVYNINLLLYDNSLDLLE